MQKVRSVPHGNLLAHLAVGGELARVVAVDKVAAKVADVDAVTVADVAKVKVADVAKVATAVVVAETRPASWPRAAT